MFGEHLFQHTVGIPMGTNCAHLPADLLLYSYRWVVIDELLKKKKKNISLFFLYHFPLYWCIMPMNKSKLTSFGVSNLSRWPGNNGHHRHSYVWFRIWSTPINWQWGPVENKTLWQRRLFQFPIVNYPVTCSHIITAPGISLSWYSRACVSYQDFLEIYYC